MLHRILHRLLAPAGYCPILLAAFTDELSPHGAEECIFSVRLAELKRIADSRWCACQFHHFRT